MLGIAIACTVTCFAVIANGESMIDESECGVSYDCWLLADGTKIAWGREEGSQWVDIQMSRKDTGDYNTPQYVSVGFSQDQQMGDDAVTECVFTGDQAAAHLSWNTGKSNQRLPADIISSHVSLVASRRSQGDFYCRVRQLIEPAADIGGVLPLSMVYYLLAATGTAKADGINIHDFTNNLPAVYTEQVNLSAKTFKAQQSVDPVAPATINGMPPLPPLPPNPNNPVVGQPTGGNPATRPPPALPNVPGNNLQPEPEAESEAEPESESEHTDHAGHDHSSSHAEGEPETEPETNTVDDNRTKQQRGSRVTENSASTTTLGAVVGVVVVAFML